MSVKVTVHKFQAFVQIPSARSWGECWWTAADIAYPTHPIHNSLPNPTEFQEALIKHYGERLMYRMLHGDD